ncbi:hypothetical protein QBC47DRAFT_61290 [Echria macrotheca]|uniref:Fungal N-terminal domain-containing protein n=1 Tax=Echria macrotheca TaxID=438768 RepID=A0AAJ0B8W8_9PEZI|nr:hypothetical protein QBC47DRAFT_61290 [Echria macrotheca]
MDPLSIAAASVGFLTALGQTIVALRAFSKKFRGDRQAARVVLDFEQQLGQLEFIVRSLPEYEPDTDNDAVKRLPEELVKQVCTNIESCNVVLTNISAFIKKLEASGLMGRVQWGFRWRDEVMDLFASLSQHQKCLDVSLDAILILTSNHTLHTATRTLHTATHASQTATHTLAATTRILEDTGQIGAHVQVTRQNTELLKQDTTTLKADVQGVSQNLDQINDYIADIVALLQRIERQQAFSFQGHCGFVPDDLLYCLKNYLYAESGVDPDELRSHLSTVYTWAPPEDDLRSLRSGWSRNDTAAPHGGHVQSQRQDAAPATPGLDSLLAGLTTAVPQAIEGPDARFINTPTARQPENRREPPSGEVVDSQDQEDEGNPQPLPKIDVLEVTTVSGGHRSSADLDELGGSSDRSHGRSVESGFDGAIAPRDTETSTLPSEASHLDSNIAHSDVQSLNDVPSSSKKIESDFRAKLRTIWEDLFPGNLRLTSINSIRSEPDIVAARNARRNLVYSERRDKERILSQINRTTRAQVVLESLEGGANPDLHSDQALRFAQTGKFTFAPPLYKALKAQNSDCVELLLRYGASPDCFLAKETPVEQLFGLVSTPTLDADARLSVNPVKTDKMALLLLGNGAKVSHEMIINAVSKSAPQVVGPLLYCAEQSVVKSLDLSQLLMLALRGRAVVPTVKVLLHLGAKPTTEHVGVCVEGGKLGVLELLLDWPDTKFNLDGHVDTVSGTDTWHQLILKSLLQHGASPANPLRVASEALRRGDELIFDELVNQVPLDPLLHDAFQVWPSRNQFLEKLLSMGAKPFQNHLDMMIIHNDEPMCKRLLGFGLKPSANGFCDAKPEISCLVLEKHGSEIPPEALQTRLDSNVQSLLHGSAQGSFRLMVLLLKHGATVHEPNLLRFLSNLQNEKELTCSILSAMGRVSAVLCNDLVEVGATQAVDHILSEGLADAPVSGLLERALESHDHTAEICGLLFNACLKAKPTVLGPRSMGFLSRQIPQETQLQVLERCRHHTTTSTVQFLFDCAASNASQLVVGDALRVSIDLLDGTADLELDPDSPVPWPVLLKSSLSLFAGSFATLPESRTMRYRCFELVLRHMEERGSDFNEGLPDGTAFSTLLFERTTAEASAKLVRLLVKYGADTKLTNLGQRPNPDTNACEEPWETAAKLGHLESLKEMIKAEHHIDPVGVLSVVVQNNSPSHIRAMLEDDQGWLDVLRARPGRRAKDGTCLIDHVTDPEVLEVLFELGLDFSVHEDLALLRQMAQSGQPKTPTSAIFLQWSVVHCAHLLHGKSLVEMLAMNSYATTERRYESSLGRALSKERIPVLVYLLRHGSKQQGTSDDTADFLLLGAVTRNDLELFKALVEAGVFCKLHSTWTKILEDTASAKLLQYLLEAKGSETRAVLKEQLHARTAGIVAQIGLAGNTIALMLDQMEPSDPCTNQIATLCYRILTGYSTDLSTVLVALLRAVQRIPSLEPLLPTVLYYLLCRSKFDHVRHDQVWKAVKEAEFYNTPAAAVAATSLGDLQRASEILQASTMDFCKPSTYSEFSRFFGPTGDHPSASIWRGNPDIGQSLIFYAVVNGLSMVLPRIIELGGDVNEKFEYSPGQAATPRPNLTKKNPRDAKRLLGLMTGRSQKTSPVPTHPLDLTATLLHLAILHCVIAPTRDRLLSGLEIIKQLVHHGASLDAAAWMPNTFLVGSGMYHIRLEQNALWHAWLTPMEFANEVIFQSHRSNIEFVALEPVPVEEWPTRNQLLAALERTT